MDVLDRCTSHTTFAILQSDLPGNQHAPSNKWNMPFDDLAPKTQVLLRRKEIVVRPFGLQEGTDRFPALRTKEAYESRRPGEVPTCKPWRLNLTRLSHVNNLYYVAYVDKIYVYEPSHPDQRLPNQPVLILSPPTSEDASQGYIDPQNSHAINHLVVDFLGDLEVVIVACDDGDVVAYFTNAVKAAIDRRRLTGGPESLFGDEVKPFLAINVELSAWGLSVHSKSRKIAISANTHKITIVSLGLHGADDKSSVERASNRHFVLSGMNNNIPSLSFCNTEDDPEGRCLINGEITGFVYINDLETMKRTGAQFMAYCRTRTDQDLSCDCPDRFAYPHGVWGTTYLDWRAFRTLDGYSPALTEDYEKHWDGTIMRNYIPDSKMAYRLRASALREDDMENDDYSDDENDSITATDGSMAWGLTESMPFLNANTGSSSPSTYPWNNAALAQPFARFRPTIRSRKFQHRAYADATDIKSPPCPILVASNGHLSLQQPSDGSNSYPVIAFNNPLQQAIEPHGINMPALSLDRMSLHALIPELGALVVGSPTGRVAVFSLLRTGGWPDRPGGTFFMRPDWLLPLASQEDEGSRPETTLVGLTVGPIQGQLGAMKSDVRRSWRLMLYYLDHSILSYELRLPDIAM